MSGARSFRCSQTNAGDIQFCTMTGTLQTQEDTIVDLDRPPLKQTYMHTCLTVEVLFDCGIDVCISDAGPGIVMSAHEMEVRHREGRCMEGKVKLLLLHVSDDILQELQSIIARRAVIASNVHFG